MGNIVILDKVVHQESRSIAITVKDLPWVPQRTGQTLTVNFSCCVLPTLNYLPVRKGQVLSLPMGFLPCRNLDQKDNEQSRWLNKLMNPYS